VALLVLVAGLVACLRPAWRVSKLDAVSILQQP
jgi:ABC-type lipoprotein release transport system permease subunit